MVVAIPVVDLIVVVITVVVVAVVVGAAVLVVAAKKATITYFSTHVNRLDCGGHNGI